MMRNWDIISIKDLQLPHGVIAPDVWGKPKEQPALVRVQLDLRGDGFSTAASKDELDASTIHYGELAKRIRSSSEQDQSAADLFDAIQQTVTEMARKPDGRFIIMDCTIELTLPKASLSGEKVNIWHLPSFNKEGKETRLFKQITVSGIKIMTLVGVNAYERTAEQPLVAEVNLCWFEGSGGVLQFATEKEAWEEIMGKLFGLEKMLVEVVRPTQYETLETLASFTIKQLQERLFDKLPIVGGYSTRLQIKKPRAIAFADAPAVEVQRSTMSPSTGSPVDSTAVGGKPVLTVIKPYVS